MAAKPDTESPLNQWMKRAMIASGFDPASRAGGRAEVARRAYVSTPTIMRMLSDPNATPSIHVLRRVGEVLGYTLGDVLIQAGLATPEELVNSGTADLPRLDPGEQRILEHAHLDEETKYAILAHYRKVRDGAIALALGSLDDLDAPQRPSSR